MPIAKKMVFGISLALLLFFLAIVALIADALFNTPDFSKLKTKVKVPIEMVDGARTTREVGPDARGWVAIKNISNNLLMAVIASEDTSFFSHQGVDLFELKEAIRRDLKEKKWARGASTITQQLLKNVYLDQNKNLWRKLKEFLWAPRLEKVLTKSEILCFYVNLVEWGPGIYGIRAAAEHYFSIVPIELSVKQAAFLVMLLPSPKRYHAYFTKRALSPWANKRVERILEVMKNMGFIDVEAYQAAIAERLWSNEGHWEGEEPDTDEDLEDELPSQVEDPQSIEAILSTSPLDEKEEEPQNREATPPPGP